MPNSRFNRNYQAEIIKYLRGVESSGQMPYQIFRDFCELAEASLRMLPAHLQSAAQLQKLAEDTPEIKELFARMRKVYKDQYFNQFAHCLSALVMSAEEGYQDVIGNVYMDYSNPNGHNGQYFTPMPVAQLMAGITIGDGLSMINDRIREAFNKARARGDVNSLLLDASVITSMALKDELHLEFFLEYILPLIIRDITPITINDPCCGSGIMFLAAAERFPRWAVNYGLVQFYGMDIDFTCVLMSKINALLYGLNGNYIKCILAMSAIREDQFPAPYQELYTEALEAQNKNDLVTLENIKTEVNYLRIQQATLFDLSDIAAVSTETGNGKNGRKKSAQSKEQNQLIQFEIPEEIYHG